MKLYLFLQLVRYFSFISNSCHASSEELCKSSGATTPLGSINSSCEPSSVGVNKEDPEKSYPSPNLINQVNVMTKPTQVEELPRNNMEAELEKQPTSETGNYKSKLTITKTMKY
jgi:hypothetical protein